MWSKHVKSSAAYLGVRGQLLEDLIDLVLEPSTQHLIGFIQSKLLDVLGRWK